VPAEIGCNNFLNIKKYKRRPCLKLSVPSS
jgi:hypothetical protein